VKRYTQMTSEERQAVIDLNERHMEHQNAVKAREAAVDALAAYLKGAKRRRPAPTMLFQYPGFEIHAFTRLTAEIERLRVIEEGALDRLYRREQRA
jgi:hypothetical protein